MGSCGMIDYRWPQCCTGMTITRAFRGTINNQWVRCCTGMTNSVGILWYWCNTYWVGIPGKCCGAIQSNAMTLFTMPPDKLCCLAEICSKIANCSSRSRGNLKKVICKGINERTKCVLSLQLSKKKSGDGFSADAVNDILATNIVKLTLTKTE